MKFTIEKAAFVAAVDRLKMVCQKNTIPMAEHVLITSSDGRDRVILRGADMFSTEVETSCSADVAKGGSILVLGRRLIETAKSAPGGFITVTSMPNGWVTVDAERMLSRIAGIKPDEYPVAGKTPEKRFAFNTNDLHRVMHAVAQDESRAVFCGVCFEAKDGKLRIAATDGHRVAMVATDIDNTLGSFIPNATGLREVLRCMSDTVQVGLTDNDAVFSDGVTTIRVRLIAGRFPSIDKVIPNKNKDGVSLEREAVMAALHRAARYAPKDTSVSISVRDKTTTIHAVDCDTGEYTEHIDCVFSGAKDLRISSRYVLDALGVFDHEQVTMQVSDSESPVLFVDQSNLHHTFVVMPMQL